MKKMHALSAVALLMILLMVAGACSKDDDPVPEEFAELSFDAEEVLAMVPDGLKNATDSYAQDCYSHIESAVDMASFIDQMEVPDNATHSKAKGSSDTWQWAWSYGGETYMFYWRYEESAGKRYWTMDIQYNNGPRYNYIDAWESLDGSEGEVIYNFQWAYVAEGSSLSDEDFAYWRYRWSFDASRNFNIQFIWDAEDGGATEQIKYEVGVNNTGSGFVDYYYFGALFYAMEWDAAGNGSWTYYVDGESFMTGTWAAGV